MLVQKNIEIRTERYSNGQPYYREFRVEDKLHRDPKDGPAYESFYKSGQLCSREFRVEYTLHRDPKDGPAHESFYESGQLYCREFWVEGKLLTDAEVATATTHPSCDGAVVEFQGRKYRLVEE